MRKIDGKGVKAVAGLTFDGKCAIEAVVDDVHACKGELRTNLMRDAREDLNFKERALLVLNGRVGDWLEAGDGRQRAHLLTLRDGEPVVRHVNHPAEGERWVMDEIVLQRAADRDGSFDEGKVGLLDRLSAELLAQTSEGGLGTGDKDKSGCVGVNAVECSGHEGSISQRATFRVACDDGIHQGSRLPATQRLYGHARRLVEGQDMFVFKLDLKGAGNGLHEIVRRFEELLYDDRLAATKLEPLGNSAGR